MESHRLSLQEALLDSDQILTTLTQMMEREGEEERGEEAKQRQDLKSLMKRIVRDTGLKEVLQN